MQKAGLLRSECLHYGIVCLLLCLAQRIEGNGVCRPSCQPPHLLMVKLENMLLHQPRHNRGSHIRFLKQGLARHFFQETSGAHPARKLYVLHQSGKLFGRTA